jgi:pyruvate formate lyase activating enzyme
VLLDIKAFKESTYRHLTGAPLRPTLEFAERLAVMAKPIWLRYVLVP